MTTLWVRTRLRWVSSVKDGDLLRVIARIAQRGDLDENLGDARERRDSILWAATRGRRGKEWGHVASAAEELKLRTGGDGG